MEIRMLKKLPNSIYINNRKYFINTNFRYMILFETKLQGIDYESEEDKTKFIIETLQKFCPAFFKNKYTISEFTKLKDKFVWFYKCGGRENYHKSSGKGTSITEVFSYEYDDEYLYSAFYGQYGVDLAEIRHLHWWKYKSLEKGLNNSNKIEKIKEYRSYTGKDEDMKALREYWKLPLNKKDQEELDKTAEMLMKFNPSNKK